MNFRYFLFRVAQTGFVLWLIVTMLFFMFRLAPGDYSSLMLQQGVDPAQAEAFKEKWGLNEPLHIQYYKELTLYAQGEFGTSIKHRKPVLPFVTGRLFNTLLLVIPGISMAYVIGASIGTVMGTKRGSNFEKGAITAITAISGLPSFFFAMLLVIIFSSWLGMFPTSGHLSSETIKAFGGTAPWWRPYLTVDFLWHYILPFSAVTIRYSVLPSLVMRTNVVEVLGQANFYYDRMVGLPKFDRLKRISKHASLPLITLYPIALAQAIGGIVLIEFIFGWPGIGYSLVQAVFLQDTPVARFIFFVIAVIVLIGNFIADIAYGFIDPRVSVGDEPEA